MFVRRVRSILERKWVVRLARFRAHCSSLERLVKPILAEDFPRGNLDGSRGLFDLPGLDLLLLDHFGWENFVC